MGILGHLWSQNDVITSYFRQTDTSNILPTSTLDMYKVFEHIDMMSKSIQIQKQPYTVIFIPTLLGSIWGYVVTCEVKMM